MSKQKPNSQPIRSAALVRDSFGRFNETAKRGGTESHLPSSVKLPARRSVERPSAEEDAKITAAAKADPDALPAAQLFAKRGRPKSAKTKQPVLLRIDQEVVAKFKQSGEGWQTRMNEALRKAAGLN